MAEQTTIPNIEIRAFQLAGGVDEADYLVISQSDGTSARLAVGLFGSYLSAGSLPNIRDGVWWVGNTDTGVSAEGETPELRRGELGVEYKYPSEDESAWRLLVPFEDIKLRYEDLTEEQQDEIRLKFSDLTEEQIAELQKPAADMIARLEETNTEVEEAEALRVQAEEGRAEAEESRVSAEEERVKEHAALKAESEEATLHATTQGDYAKEQGDYAKEQGEIFESLSPDLMLGTFTDNPAGILD